MARYKHYSYEQTKMIPLSFDRQILPGTFEYTLNRLIDEEIDLSIFSKRYKNDVTGATAYDPAILLKIILYAYSRGIMRSRVIARCCEENIIFMALSAETKPHFTTIANFISGMREEIITLFREVLLVCDDLQLIGKEMFAVDGCKLPSNAAKEWSGTRADFEKKAQKFEKAIQHMLDNHGKQDEAENTGGATPDEEAKHIKNLREKAQKVREWLSKNDDKRGPRGSIRKSNITDNESAKMPSSHGVIQGYNGVATVDAKHQVIVHAEAFGESQEQNLLLTMLEGTAENLTELGDKEETIKESIILADSGFHSENNIEYLVTEGYNAYIADNNFRKRDPRFITAEQHKDTLYVRATEKNAKPRKFKPSDFTYNSELGTCTCPAGNKMKQQGNIITIRDFRTIRFKASVKDCRTCRLRTQCLANENTIQRQVYFFDHKGKVGKETYSHQMKNRIDTFLGRYFYSKRMGIVEPVFGNIRATLGLNHFSLRSKIKTNVQWLLFCTVHNIGKIHRYAPIPS